eukprot:6909131-Alexandrium_andersonii.AAC.1
MKVLRCAAEQQRRHNSAPSCPCCGSTGHQLRRSGRQPAVGWPCHLFQEGRAPRCPRRGRRAA